MKLCLIKCSQEREAFNLDFKVLNQEKLQQRNEIPFECTYTNEIPLW